MKYISFLLFFILPFVSWSQQITSGKIESSDTVTLQVIRIFPDSFPTVSVVFKASGPNGQSINNLDTSNVKAKEDGVDCKVRSVTRISNNWAVNTALVIDHSGSMRMDDKLRRHWDSLPASAWTPGYKTMREHTNGEVDSDSMIQVRTAPQDPAWYHTPLWYAQSAARSYVNQTDASKDRNALIGFSTDVDVSLALTANHDAVNDRINSLTTSGETAFYDAVSAAIDQADKGDGIRVVIAMTDGKDNNSRQTLDGLIIKAKTKKIPLYIIGLGDVDIAPLKRLARETGGQAYFTTDAATLTSIYTAITKEIQSIYEVVYESPSLSSADSTRDVQLLFHVDDDYLNSRILPIILPKEVIARLEERERELAAQSVAPMNPESPAENEFPWGTTGIVLGVLAAGALTATWLRKKSNNSVLVITSVYPNPTAGPFTVQLNNELISGTLSVHAASGSLVNTLRFAGSTASADISEQEPGTYIVTVHGDGKTAVGIQLVVTK